MPSREQFERDALAEGFVEVYDRVWPPGKLVPTHSHPFPLKALVVEGEMWLTCRGVTHHLLPGGTFELDGNEPHEELYGEAGATYWVARRN
ncbi:MAG: AraC family transcriptional regulator [Rhodocyclaceae bacterium]|nr:AraC family transcriptional regulator [Rhodocyclaceae bacterium]MBX3669669.1 AraC family transcriptional regulator [Rhodocyclaceae bacterium]